MSYKIDPLDDARFDFEPGDEVIYLSTNGSRLGKATVDSELSPGLYGITVTTGPQAGKGKGINGCLLRKAA